MEYHKFCPECKSRILTIEQMRENKPCDPCQRDRIRQPGDISLPQIPQAEKVKINEC
jgi:hypothetical protein